MDNLNIILAKCAALKRNFEMIAFPWAGKKCETGNLDPLIDQYYLLTKLLKTDHSNLYSDLPEVKKPVSDRGYYRKSTLSTLESSLGYILELHSNIRIGERSEELEDVFRIFISHGRNPIWRELQDYLEKDLDFQTLELAQEPNLGRTVFQKLMEESKKCSIAIIVMTGDDIANKNEVRARENVIHELGLFQGLYGSDRVILLHETDVNIPTNIQGIVYIPFQKESINMTFGALLRELKVLSKS